MKIFEIKGVWAFIGFVLLIVVAAALVSMVPITATWLGWNAVIGDVMGGPTIAFWQASILALALILTLFLFLQPYISFEIKRVHPLDELPDERDDESEPTNTSSSDS